MAASLAMSAPAALAAPVTGPKAAGGGMKHNQAASIAMSAAGMDLTYVQWVGDYVAIPVTVTVTDNAALKPEDVSFAKSTAGIDDAKCVRENGRTVVCTLTVASTGVLNVDVVDRQGNASEWINGGTGEPGMNVIIDPVAASASWEQYPDFLVQKGRVEGLTRWAVGALNSELASISGNAFSGWAGPAVQAPAHGYVSGVCNSERTIRTGWACYTPYSRVTEGELVDSFTYKLCAEAYDEFGNPVEFCSRPGAITLKVVPAPVAADISWEQYPELTGVQTILFPEAWVMDGRDGSPFGDAPTSFSIFTATTSSNAQYGFVSRVSPPGAPRVWRYSTLAGVRIPEGGLVDSFEYQISGPTHGTGPSMWRETSYPGTITVKALHAPQPDDLSWEQHPELLCALGSPCFTGAWVNANAGAPLGDTATTFEFRGTTASYAWGYLEGTYDPLTDALTFRAWDRSWDPVELTFDQIPAGEDKVDMRYNVCDSSGSCAPYIATVHVKITG